MKKLIFLLLLFIKFNFFSQNITFTFIDEFLVNNSIEKLDVLNIDEIYKFDVSKGEVRIIVTGNGGATDFGAYKTTYLVYDNGSETPWRYAVYEIGQFGNINNVIQKSKSIYEIDGILYLYSKDNTDIDCYDCDIILNLNISNVIKEENNLSDSSIEGNIDSQIKISLYERKE